MYSIRYELIYATLSKAFALCDISIQNDIHKRSEFYRQFVLTDKHLTSDEKTHAIRKIEKDYDRKKVLFNEGTRRICEICNQECLATSYCEYCIRNYLRENFSNWTSGNDDIDNLIQNCQMETLMPGSIVEWIPYNSLKNIKYISKGGFSEIYTAEWISGYYKEWDSEKQQLKRVAIYVVLKKLENVESANKRWFEEAKSHLTIGNKWSTIVPCYGLTQDPLNGNYMLVMNKMSMDLRKYLQQNHYQLTWKERIRIASEIINALFFIHHENMIHKDLHSGNILYSQFNDKWCIGDLGFCGPADKSSESMYGNLPYIAPEAISEKKYGFKSDIYSIAMIMWEISSGQPPFMNYEHDYDLAVNIINGMRPKIVPEIPLEYKSLMEQCWDADPLMRPDISTLWRKIKEISIHYQDKLHEPSHLEISNPEMNYQLFTSKIHKFENLPKPRNAEKEEQEAFYNKFYISRIADNIDDDKLSNQSNNDKTSKISNFFKVNSEKLSKAFKSCE